MLAPWILKLLIPQHHQRTADALAGFVRQYHIVDKAARAGNEGVGESGLVLGFPCGQLDRVALVFFFITLTAPGVDELPWDKAICNHLPTMKCSGELGCKVDEFAVAIWNENAKQNWSWLLTYLRRELETDVQFAAVWELQKRGALHRHALVHAAGISVKRMEQTIRALAAKWGFGVQIDVKAIAGNDAFEMARRAGYLASYVTKEIGSAKLFDRKTGEPKEGGVRAWSSSRRWGHTMGKVKEDRLIWVRARAVTAQGAQGAPSGGAAAAPCALGGEAALDTKKEIYTNPP